MLLQEECHRELSIDHQTTEPIAFGVDRRRLPSNATHFKHQPQAKHHKNTPSKKPYYFCDHCKVVGHSINRCFKIHGYPNKSKNSSSKKYAVVAHADNSNSPSPNGNSFGLSQEQFTNILPYFGKKDSSPDRTIDDHLDVDSSINLAGTCFLSQTSKNVWIVDSGATDHRSHNLSFFFNLKDVSNLHHQITIPDGSNTL